ncbi:hypothetical protein CERZMDRAFT_94202 [Cercospora zeae-maydis SCOH1-5]|uniref:Uncharacterized protein n=1 Tax=Cercospora zeae-maydis SCOH1-5 TaxID=717836 RepID=A0A6A6FQY0_9PEZI|nr:hypothetical protein CERZMDRAFT_94202 [Cercospora zeae-maydis SCOH1-5]
MSNKSTSPSGMAPSRPNWVGSLYDTSEARQNVQQTPKEALANTQPSSTYLQPGTWRGQRPDGHPVREDSLRAMPDRPRTSPSPIPQPSPASWSLPVESADQAAAGTREAGKGRLEEAAKRLVGAASKGIKRVPQAFRRQEPLESLEPEDSVGPIISRPKLDEWRNPTGHQIVPRRNASGLEDVRARQNWEEKMGYARHVPEQTAEPPRPTIEKRARRRVVESTWGAFQAAAIKCDTPPEETAAPEETTPETMIPSHCPRHNDADETSRTTRKPFPQPNVEKSLPPTPSPDSARRRTLVRPSSAGANLPSSGPFTVRTNAWYRPAIDFVKPLEPIAQLDEKAIWDREKALRALEGRTDEAPAASRPMRVAQITAHLRQMHASRPVEPSRPVERSHAQHHRAPKRPDVLPHRPSDENDDATNIWRRLEKDAGYRMRD